MGEVCRECIKTKPLNFSELNWALNHSGQGKYDTVLFLLSSKALWRGMGWAKWTESVCCFSACWSWVESNLSVQFCSARPWRSAARSLSRMETRTQSATLRGPSAPRYSRSSAARCRKELVRVSRATSGELLLQFACKQHRAHRKAKELNLGSPLCESPTLLGLLPISNM